jgi:hypothetical protein
MNPCNISPRKWDMLPVIQGEKCFSYEIIVSWKEEESKRRVPERL